MEKIIKTEGVIYLDKYLAKSAEGQESHVFLGFDRGNEVAMESHIYNMVQFDRIRLVVSTEIYHINPNFLQGLLFAVNQIRNDIQDFIILDYTSEENKGVFDKHLAEALKNLI